MAMDLLENDVIGAKSLHPLPTVDSDVAKVYFPCSGRKDYDFTITVINPSKEKLTFKVTTSKVDKFSKIFPTYGFVEPKDTKAIIFQPKKMENDDGWNKHDNILIYIRSCPKPLVYPAKELWTMNLLKKEPIIVRVGLKSVKGWPPVKEIKEPAPVCQPQSMAMNMNLMQCPPQQMMMFPQNQQQMMYVMTPMGPMMLAPNMSTMGRQPQVSQVTKVAKSKKKEEENEDEDSDEESEDDKD